MDGIQTEVGKLDEEHPENLLQHQNQAMNDENISTQAPDLGVTGASASKP